MFSSLETLPLIQNQTMTTKKIKLELVGLDSNAFVLLGAFRDRAEKEGWKEEEINQVITEATSGDYNKLLRTLILHCE